ncbi:MAG: BREX system P-loop protein BrxC [Myxococcota bacterium]|jgi:hypothetical protein|nr:BREX system P-loop protein BrxC [Myxococcota bacterium]
MRIGELFEIKVEEKIEPVIKVGERSDERKLAGEIGSYVITPSIEKYLDDFLEQYTDSFLRNTTEIGVWISGYFGSGKSHLAKIMALLVENKKLVGIPACERFKARVPPQSDRRSSIEAALTRMGQTETTVLAFNLNTLADSRTRPLPQLLLSQYYQSKGYGGNLFYAKVIEQELDRQGKLDALHQAVEARTGKSWADIQGNLSFFSRHLSAAACEVAPDAFDSPDAVIRAMREAERGELYNVGFLVETVLADLKRKEKTTKRNQRLVFVLDESGQWIENDAQRLAQLQALIEEAAIKGQGKIWLVVTTHGDMGSIYKDARALDGDMKKIEGRFRFHFPLTTENIEEVLENRLFRKTVAGRQELGELYERRAGVLRGLGELSVVNRKLTDCTPEKFATYYPFFPYQVSLIPNIVRSLRSKGGRGEQLSGSTRTLLAITQDVLRAGRRRYLDEEAGPMVSFDEVYYNLAGEGEVTPDVRTELARLGQSLPGATPLTTRLAEVLYLIREINFIPRTAENIARLMVEHVEDDLPAVLARVQPELDRLVKAKLVGLIGDEYEFLTGERRTFEEEVDQVEQSDFRSQQDRDSGFSASFVQEKSRRKSFLAFESVSFKDVDFPIKMDIDGTYVPGTKGDVSLEYVTPLAHGREQLADLEGRSLRADKKDTIFFFSGRVNGLDRDLTRYLAVREVCTKWSQDSNRSEEARKLAQEREANDLPKLERRVLKGLKEGMQSGWVVFRGSSHSLSVREGQKPEDALRADLATIWPQIYPKFEKVPVRIADEEKLIRQVLAGEVPSARDSVPLKLFDKGGKVDLNCPLLDALRIHLTTEGAKGKVYGKDVIKFFTAPVYGWDANAVRVGVAALVRAGALKVMLKKKVYTNPADKDLFDALRNSRTFSELELELEEIDLPQEVLTETRSFLIKLAKRRSLDETPSALCEAAGILAADALMKAEEVRNWAEASGLPFPAVFEDGTEAWDKVRELTNPVPRVKEVHALRPALESGLASIHQHAEFRTQHGPQFIEFNKLVLDLTHIEYRVEEDSSIKKLLEANTAALAAASYADKETWKQLQVLRAQALLELQGLVDGWKEDARQEIAREQQRLDQRAAELGLEAPVAAAACAPLQKLLGEIGAVTETTPALQLSDRVKAAAKAAEKKLRDEADKRKPKDPQPPIDGGGGGGQKPRPPAEPKHLKLKDVTKRTRVTTLKEWEAVRTTLDEQVRKWLTAGHVVELD